MTDGRFELLLPEHPALWVFLRHGDAAMLLVAANFSAQAGTARLPLEPAWAAAPAILRTHQHQPAAALPDIELRPWESAVWRLSNHAADAMS